MSEVGGRGENPTCVKCAKWAEVKDKIRLAELVASTAAKIEARFKDQEFKPTLGDYLKLLQLGKDLEEETVKEIKVTWVVPTEEE